MESDDVSDITKEMRHEVVEELISELIPENSYKDQWNLPDLEQTLRARLNLQVPFSKWFDTDDIGLEDVIQKVIEEFDKATATKASNFGPDALKHIEKQVLLQSVDKAWRDHLLKLDHLRTVVAFRGYAQRDPLNEYKSEAFILFESMLGRIRIEVTKFLAFVQIMSKEEQQTIEEKLAQEAKKLGIKKAQDASFQDNRPIQARAVAERNPNDPNTWGRVSRNAPCPCGSGKKYKHCHG